MAQGARRGGNECRQPAVLAPGAALGRVMERNWLEFVRNALKPGAVMWMSDVMIVVDPKNADRNGVSEIVEAVKNVGANVIGVNDTCSMIEATLPAHEVPIVAHMEGVSYVRSVFTYLVNPPDVAA
jgi:hypothetical protein